MDVLRLMDYHIGVFDSSLQHKQVYSGLPQKCDIVSGVDDLGVSWRRRDTKIGGLCSDQCSGVSLGFSPFFGLFGHVEIPSPHTCAAISPANVTSPFDLMAYINTLYSYII